MPSLVSVVNLTQPRVTQEEGTFIEELPRSDWPEALSVEHFLNC